MRSLLAILALAALGCAQSHASEAPSPPANELWVPAPQAEDARLSVAVVADHDVHGTLVTSGRIAFDDLRVDHVISPVSGRVVEIAAQPGDHVVRGQPLAVIDSPDLGLASADVAKAEADVIAAEHDYKRQKELAEVRAVAQRDLEAAEDAYRRARAELDRAAQKARLLGRGGAVGQRYVLRAHIDGEVIARNVNPGAEVQGQYAGGAAVELFTIGDASRVWALADVREADLAQVKPGERVTVKVVAYPDRELDGKVDWVSGALDPVTRTARVRAVIDNAERLLKPEMLATVAIAVPGKKTLAIPRSAVMHMGDQTVVLVPSGQAPDGRVRFERRPVVVDEREPGAWVPLARGLDRGERVVDAGTNLLTGT